MTSTIPQGSALEMLNPHLDVDPHNSNHQESPMSNQREQQAGDNATKKGLTHSKSSLSIGLSVMPGQPKMTLASFEAASARIVEEYIATNDSATAVGALKALDCASYHDVLVVKAVQMVLREPEEIQARIAQLLTLFYDAKLLTRPQATRGFEKLIQLAGSIREHIDRAEDKLFSFFTSAADDGVVDSVFLQKLPEALIRQLTPAITDNEPHLLENAHKLKVYKQKCADYMDEFFNDGSVDALRCFFKEIEPIVTAPTAVSGEDCAAVSAVTSDVFRHEMVRRLLMSSLSRSSAQKEMVSRVLSDCYGSGKYELQPDDIQLGVLRLLATVEDLSLDCPNASDLISKFVVRMVVDEGLPPAFVSDFIRLSLGDEMGVETLRRAFRWMTADSGKHHLLVERFQKVWTGTDGYRPEVEEFKRVLREIIFDYFNTGDGQSTISYFHDLEMSPDQGIEAVRKIIVFAMERRKEEWDLALILLNMLKGAGELDTEALAKGFLDIQEKMLDIKLDCPGIEEAMQNFFVPEAIARDLVPPHLLRVMKQE